MAFLKNLALLALVSLCLAAAVEAKPKFIRPTSLPLLPTDLMLPGNCGSIYQVLPGDSCQSIANYAGISLKTFRQLNPFTLCGILPLVPGWPVCSGDKLSFCSNRFVTSKGDSCASIVDTLGSILALQPGASCSNLGSEVDVCIAPSTNACAVDNLCGATISANMQALFATVPDYCTIASSCEAPLASGTNSAGQETLTIALTDVTPSVQSVLGNDGHPELQAFADALASNPAKLQVTFTPGGLTDGSNLVSFVGSAVASSGRKLQQGTSYPPSGGSGTPRYYYYGR